jgi:SAM-dependent methyltransferase
MPATEEWFRQVFDDLYLTIYAKRNADEAERIADWLVPLSGAEGARVLDLACGAGRFFVPLARTGSLYVGLDLSRPLLDEAVRRRGDGGARPHVVRADMRRVPFRDGTLDVVLSIFTSIGYFEDEDDERTVIAEIARVLVPGGRFTVDLINPEPLRRSLVPRGERRAAGYVIREERSLRGDIVVKKIHVSNAAGDDVRNYVERVRLIPLATLEAWCRERCLGLRWTRGDYTGGRYDPETSRRLIAGFVKEAE